MNDGEPGGGPHADEATATVAAGTAVDRIAAPSAVSGVHAAGDVHAAVASDGDETGDADAVETSPAAAVAPTAAFDAQTPAGGGRSNGAETARAENGGGAAVAPLAVSGAQATASSEQAETAGADAPAPPVVSGAQAPAGSGGVETTGGADAVAVQGFRAVRRSPAVAVVPWRVPRTWRVLLTLARLVVMPVARLRVTGGLPEDLRGGPVILAVNHIGPFDPIAITAACRVAGLAPRLMATGGLFRAPVVGSVMRAAGHIRINRRQANVAEAVHDVAEALAAGSHVLGYPEGRITLDPAMWPERGKTGMARIALATGAPVVAVAQWGAHEVAAWGGFGPTVRALGRALVRRPVVRVHFGGRVDLSGIDPSAPGAAQRATDRIIDAITGELRPLRVDEPRLPRYVDPVRPLSVQRRHRPSG